MTDAIASDGWSAETSPYHAGEAAMQDRAGVRDRAERQGRRMIRSAMPDQHRDLFEKLSYLFVGSLDAERRPWASMLAGPPGFARSPDAQTLAVDALPLPDTGAVLAPGAPLGLLGIELSTRRRNRVNGRIVEASGRGFVLRVDQSFGNCPQYIQARTPEPRAVVDPAAPSPVGRVLGARAAALVRTADTFFIASASPHAGGPDPTEGVDVSHRGGRAGFVKLAEEDGRSVLLAPDFRGNAAFNTFGNLALNPRAGLLFIDFAAGDLLSLTGEAEVLWDHPALAGFAGARRLLRFRLDAGVLLAGAVPLRWSPPEPAPQLAATGTWDRPT